MKIYLAAPVFGKFDKEQERIRAISNVLTKNQYEIVNPFVVDVKLNDARFPHLKGTEQVTAMFIEDMRLILESDVVIAEISEPSTKVGIELGFLLGRKTYTGRIKHTLCLRHEDLFGQRISTPIEGNQDLIIKYYDHKRPEEFEQKIVYFLRNVENVEGIIRHERE